MKQLCLCIFILLAVGCSPIKYYTLVEVSNADQANLTAINLDSYNFYKRELYYKNTGTTITKDYVDKIADPSKTRYELQTILIEKSPAPGQNRKVIFFSCYPPYEWYGRNVYDYPFYDNFTIFNIESVNYIMFGEATGSSITFKRKGYDSVWNYQIVGGNITVSDVQFKDNCTIVNPLTNLLGNIPIYKPMGIPSIMLQEDVRDPVGSETTDFLNSNTIYYDRQSNELYFHFSGPLNTGDPKDWIYFKSDRILAPLP